MFTKKSLILFFFEDITSHESPTKTFAKQKFCVWSEQQKFGRQAKFFIKKRARKPAIFAYLCRQKK